MLLLIATWLFSVNAFAQTVESVEIDGIYYNLVTKGKIAEVTQNPNKYSGTINIPETITYNDISYYVLVWDKWTGAYKYPTIYEDWEYWRTKIFFMFTEKDMEKLRNLTNNPSTIEILTLTRGRLDQNVQDVDVIQYEMNNNFQQKSKIEIYKATDGSVRFLFKEGLFSGIHKIETSYFEISELDYNKLMNIKL